MSKAQAIVRPGLAALTALAIIAGFFIATSIQASHGSPFINLTIADNQVNHNGARFVQGGIGAGTGSFDPFLTVNAGGSTTTEQGYNTTSASGEFDTFFGGGRTHPLKASAVPAIEVGGILYREFLLDYNETGSEDFVSIDVLKFYLDNQNNLTDYVDATNSFGSDDGAPTAVKIYDMDAGGDTVLLMCTQSCASGSGVSDVSALLPDSIFPADCYYGSLTCDDWIYLYFFAGGYAEGSLGIDPVPGTQNWGVTGGFEEWRTELIPVVNVAKTAEVSYTITYDWTLDKQVSIDGGTTWVDDASVDLFVGDSQDYLWRLVATRLPGVVSDQVISGAITITNPTGGDVIADEIPANITSIVDNIDFDDATPDLNNITLNCPDTLPTTLGAGDSFVCTYSVAVPGATQDTTGTNEVTVVVEDAGTDFFASDTFDFGDATVTTIDASATLSDPEVPAADGQVVLDSDTFQSSTNTYTCGEDTLIENTGSLTEGDTGQVRSDSASLTIDCWELSVSKDANTSLTRTFDWTLVKEVSIDGGTTWVDSASVEINFGQSQDYLWRLVATKGAGVDSAWLVQGTITINNPAPIAATNVSVSDALSTDGAATVDCGGGATTVNIAAESSAQCTYSKSLPGANNQTNTATATLFSHDVTGSANVDFSTATVTEVDAQALLSDPEVVTSDQLISASQTFVSSTQTYTCGETITIVNNGQLTETGSGQVRMDSAQITITCIPADEGCTPGYWRNHLDAWAPTGYSPGDDFDTTFGVDLFDPDITLEEAVNLGGGGVNKLARHGVAGLLSAAHPDVSYPYTVAEVIALVQAGDADALAAANQLGCPLNN